MAKKTLPKSSAGGGAGSPGSAGRAESSGSPKSLGSAESPDRLSGPGGQRGQGRGSGRAGRGRGVPSTKPAPHVEPASLRPGKSRSRTPDAAAPPTAPVRRAATVSPPPGVIAKPSTARPAALARGPGIQIQPGRQMLFISQSHLEQLPWETGEVLNHVQIALRELGRGKVDTPPQISLYPQRESLLSATAAFVPNVQACGLKWFSSFPTNQRLQLPQVCALVILSDPQTGFPIALIDASWLVAQRGPAVSAVAARLLARPDSTTATIVGGGLQGRGHIPALADVLGKLATVWVYDTAPGQAAKAARWAAEKITRKIKIEPVTDLQQAVRESDVIVSATAMREESGATIHAAWIRSGALVLPLDLDAVFEPAVFEQADRFYVDSLDDLKALHEKGVFLRAMPPNVTGQLGHLLAGRIDGRSAEAETIVCLNIGVGSIDIVLARAVFEKACRLGVGQVLEL